METLAQFTPHDVAEDVPAHDYGAFKPRQAVRGIVYAGKKVALIHVGLHDYYMLPGGGTDGQADAIALQRELREELGATVEIGEAVGHITVYFDRWQQKQTDTCYVARVVGGAEALTPTAFEQQEAHAVVWAPSLEAAIMLMSEARPATIDGRLIQARDLVFLHAVQARRSPPAAA